jgi:hypothetical protein
MVIFNTKKRMIIYFLVLTGTTNNPRISIINAIMVLDPLMPPLKIQRMEFPINVTIIIGVIKGLTIFLNLTK